MTAQELFKDVHGSESFLCRPAVIAFAEKYYAEKLLLSQAAPLQESYFKQSSKKKKDSLQNPKG